MSSTPVFDKNELDAARATLEREFKKLRERGFRGVPLDGKSPAHMTHPQTKETMRYRRKKAPFDWELTPAIPGVGRETEPGTCVVDPDSEEALAWVCEKIRVSPTELHTLPNVISTKKGFHFHYRVSEEKMPKHGPRKDILGFPLDVIAGSGKGYTPLPGSRRSDGVIYTFLGEGELDWDNLPIMPADLLEGLSQDAEGNPLIDAPRDVDKIKEQGEGRNNRIYSTLCSHINETNSLTRSSWKELAFALNAQFDEPLEEKEVLGIVNSALSKLPTISEEHADCHWLQAPFSGRLYRDAELKKGFATSLLPEAFNKLGYEFRFNVRSNTVEYFDRRDQKWQGMSKAVVSALVHTIRGRFFTRGLFARGSEDRIIKDSLLLLPFGKWEITDAVGYTAKKNRVDPFVSEYLCRVAEPLVWDGKDRISTAISDFFDVGDTPKEIVALAGRSLLHGAVKRCLYPGSKHDEVVALLGPEGCFKSTFCAKLLPDERYHLDNFDFGMSIKEVVEQTLGKVIVEIAEAKNMTGRNAQHIKAMLSAFSDKVRLSYEPQANDYPRRFIFVLTSNLLRVLPHDPRGNRRFIPIAVKRKIVNGSEWEFEDFTNQMNAIRDQLWAQARTEVMAGQTGHVPEELRRVMQIYTEDFAHEPELSEKIKLMLDEWESDTITDKEIRDRFNLSANIHNKMLYEAVESHRRSDGKRHRKMIKGETCYQWILKANDSEDVAVSSSGPSLAELRSMTKEERKAATLKMLDEMLNKTTV